MFTKFEETTVEWPAIPCAGLKVATTMANAEKDATALWGKFIEIAMTKFPKSEKHAGETYGASVMTDMENFSYWTLAPLEEDQPNPEGTERFTIPAGKYAKFSVPSIQKIGQCYGYIMEKWFPENQHRADFTRHTIELYDKEFESNSNFYVLFPVSE
jgi:predicted transcriptional regulator YdeE